MTEPYPEIPEEIKELLERGEAIDEIRLDRNGGWLHNGKPFTNRKIIDFFNRSIGVTRDGTHVVQYDRYVYPIVVEDAPLFVTGVRYRGFGRWEKIEMNLSNGATEVLDIHSLEYRNKTFYCRVCGGRMTAKFRNSPFFHIMERLEEVNGTFYLGLCGEKIIINQD
jgi:hypothetical protein